MSRITPRPIYQKGQPAPRATASKSARKNARGKDCTLRLPGCQNATETTVLCHLRLFGWAGMAQKPADYLAVFGCAHCHDILDRRGTKAIAEPIDILRALGETLQQQFQDGVFKQ